MGDYLSFLSLLAGVQQEVPAWDLQLPDVSLLERASTHGMPLLPRESLSLDPAWRMALAWILELMDGSVLPDAARQVVCDLRAAEAPMHDALAARFLHGQLASEDVGSSLFIAAALQVTWTRLAAALPLALVQIINPPGLCPVCGSPPVAGTIMGGLPLEGLRYLSCGLCATQWHFPRSQCSLCQSEKDIAYLAFDGLESPARGECCQECRTYLKLFDEAKSPGVEPFADDLATVGLDLRLAEDGWQRAGPNLFMMAGR